MEIRVAQKGFNKVRAAMVKADRQVAFATAVALTRTAGLSRDAISSHMPKVFDRPTRFTLNSMFIIPAKRDNLVSYVRMKDAGDRGAPAAKWLAPQIEGSARRNKGSEKRLRSKGVLPRNKYLAPGEGARLDRYGNIGRRAMTNIIQGLGAGGRYFVIGPADDPVGIAERMGKRSIRVVLAFVSKPNYSRRLDFYGVGNKAVDKHLTEEFHKAYARALATAR